MGTDTTQSLKDQVILVTGASKGIGHALASHLMARGARVALHGHSGKKEVDELAATYPQTGSEVFLADLEKEEDVVRLFTEVENSFGRINTLVINAGVYLEHPLDEPMEDWFKTWKKTLAINLDAAGILTKLGIAHFRKHGSGRFVFIGSRAAFRGETEEFLAYAASKGGLTSLSRSIARSFGKDNITSFVLAPGFTRTQMAETFIQKYGEARVLKEIALNELTEPEDLAPLVTLMCSGGMDHATGCTIDMNAGSHIR
jgi:NAD(P)-dependent dehydrogenase (short-subunit alcohol dehydrogenase family)